MLDHLLLRFAMQFLETNQGPDVFESVCHNMSIVTDFSHAHEDDLEFRICSIFTTQM